MSATSNGIDHPSPNFGPRRHGLPPDMVVLHFTAMNSCADALDRLCDPGPEVSSHYLISETGVQYNLVAEDQRAWHAGAGQWGGVTDVNSHSIGIELANQGGTLDYPPFAAAQMDQLEVLLDGILIRWSIPPERVIGHSDMAPLRKFDPGPKLDWCRLARRGLAVWPNDVVPAQADWPAFRAAARVFGYQADDQDDVAWNAILFAFRTRFNLGPNVSPDTATQCLDLSEQDMGCIQTLIGNHPCAAVSVE